VIAPHCPRSPTHLGFTRKQRGQTDGGVQSCRWNLTQFLECVRAQTGRLAKTQDLTQAVIQTWMDEMAAMELAVNTSRCRQAGQRASAIGSSRGRCIYALIVAARDRGRPREERVLLG
jgi:hypothetical protein